jgi:uncharacterized protein YndB with AHSA1/START domain
MQIDPTAPATHTQSIEINAPVRVVWELLAHIEQWPAWNPDIKSVHLQGALRPETIFTWKTSSGTITSTLKVIEPNHEIGWTGKAMGLKAVHVWRLESDGSATIATSEESWGGWMSHLLGGYAQRLLATSTATALERLKAAAESKS